MQIPASNRIRRTLAPLAAAVALALALPARGGEEAYVPAGPEWETVAPDAAGFDVAALEASLAFAGERNANAVVILRGGRIAAERYWGGWDRDTAGPFYSATKSLVSVLVGQALEAGALESLDQPSAAFVPEWIADPREAIRIRHHLSMSTGLRFRGAGREIVAAALARDERAHAAGIPLERAPGTAWAYHNPAYRLLLPILEAATGRDLEAWSRETLFDPLGMEHVSWNRKVRRGIVNLQHVEGSARDLARFGLMVLRRGAWGEKRVVSEAYLKEATRPSQESNPCYGYLWWLNGGGSYRLPDDGPDDPAREGRLCADVPADAVAALGARDQKLYVIPSLDLVIVRLGGGAGERRLLGGRRAALAPSDFDNPFVSGICRAVQGDGGGDD